MMGMVTDVCMISMAMVTIIYGSLRSLWFAEKGSTLNDGSDLQDIIENRESIYYMDWKFALTIPLVGSITLVLLFYFFSYLNVLLFILVCIYAVYAIYFTMKPLLEYLQQKYNKKGEERKVLTVFSIGISIEDIICLLIASSITLGYAYYHHWILNNLIGFAFVIVYLSYLRIPNLKIASILLFGLFIYDIFWVFYSEPIFKRNVMVTVAKSVEIPAKFMIPRMGHKGSQSFSMLGLGDVVMPGVLLSFLIRFDSLRKKRLLSISSYFMIGILGYLVGLLSTYLCLIVFKVAQPALLYIVPSVMLPIFTVSIFRGDFFQLWNGISEQDEKRKSEEETYLPTSVSNDRIPSHVPSSKSFNMSTTTSSSSLFTTTTSGIISTSSMSSEMDTTYAESEQRMVPEE